MPEQPTFALGHVENDDWVWDRAISREDVIAAIRAEGLDLPVEFYLEGLDEGWVTRIDGVLYGPVSFVAGLADVAALTVEGLQPTYGPPN
jgi:hypothetical protein